MAMVNMNNLLNGKDSRWLQLEVCREFQRNKCTRPDTECKFAHPPANVEVQNGRVTACYDSIKGRCNREKPPCKYFHPPQHLKDQLLINGRNHLALKNALMQQMGLSSGQALVPGQVPTVTTNPYLTGLPQVNNAYNPYFTPSQMIPAIMGSGDPVGVGNAVGVVPQSMALSQKLARTDRLEMESKTFGSFYYENIAFPGMVPYKRPAGDKTGMPVYQATGATTYQQLMQLPQPFVPISCEYAGTPPLPQTSNQSITNAQNSIQTQASLNVTEVNGVLVDAVSNASLPPSGNNNGGVIDGKPLVSHHEGDNPRNSPELNDSGSPQINQLVTHTPSSMSPMATSMPSVSNLTSMGNVSSIPNMTSIASMANIHQASMNSMANYTMANMANFNVLNTLGMGSCFTTMDPAALAKEVAQKNYAKAIKLSQASQPYRMNPLTALSYTGVALNKQAIAMNQNNAAVAAAAAAASGNTAPRQIIPAGLAGIPGSAMAPTMPAGLLHYPRVSSAAPISPYSLIRQHPILPNHYVQASMTGVPTASAIQQAANPYIHNPYAMLPGMTTMHGVAGLTGVPTVVSQMQTANPATIAAQPQVAIPASTSVIMQPYKKMKTT